MECAWLCVSVCTFKKIPGFYEKSPEHPKEVMRRLPLLSRKVATGREKVPFPPHSLKAEMIKNTLCLKPTNEMLFNKGLFSVEGF